MGTDPMKVAYEKNIFGRQVSMLTTTSSGDQGQRVLENVGVGNPFWAWNSVNVQGFVSSINFSFGTGFSWGDGAPKCAATAAENNAILAELAEFGPAPEDVIVWRT